MNMYEIVERIRQFYVTVTQAEQGAGYLVQTREGMIVLIAAAVAGILIGFFGLKIVRFWAGFFGLGAGLAGGTAVALLLEMDGVYAWIPSVVLGVILAGLMAWLYRFGVFALTWAAVFAICAYIISPDNMIMWGVCAVVGLVFALLSIRFLSVITIFVTAVFGGLLAGSAIFAWIPVEGSVVYAGVCGLTVIICLVVQLLLESRKRKRQSLKKAAEIRKTHSTANEVERARALAENLDKFDEEPEVPADSAEKDMKTEPEEINEEDFADLEETDEEEFVDLEEIDEEEFVDLEETDEEEFADLEEIDEDDLDYLDENEEEDYLDDEEQEAEPDYLDDEEIDYLDDEEFEEPVELKEEKAKQ